MREEAKGARRACGQVHYPENKRFALEVLWVPSFPILPIPRSQSIDRFFVVPVKYEQVVFCGLSDFQLALYRLFIQSPDIKALLRGANSQPLKAINILKKLCNHPELLDLPNDLQGSENLIPEGFCGAGASSRDRGRNQGVRCDWGGKFIVLERLVARTLPQVTLILWNLQIFAQNPDRDERQDCVDQQLYPNSGPFRETVSRQEVGVILMTRNSRAVLNSSPTDMDSSDSTGR